MQFSAITLIALVAGHGLAGPALSPKAREVAATPDDVLVENSIKLAMASDCSALSCASVIANAACIAGGIAIRKPSTVIKCVSGGASKVRKTESRRDVSQPPLPETGANARNHKYRPASAPAACPSSATSSRSTASAKGSAFGYADSTTLAAQGVEEGHGAVRVKRGIPGHSSLAPVGLRNCS